MHTLDGFEVYIDGLVEPVNPGGTGVVGIIVYRDGKKICRIGKKIGEGPEMSSNRAEYEALVEALQWLLDRGFSKEQILIHSDSNLLIKQMQGQWRMKGGLYAGAQKKARTLSEQFTHLSFQWIPREENEEADLLTREAYDEYMGL
jgi:ribonuclease HI